MRKILLLLTLLVPLIGFGQSSPYCGVQGVSHFATPNDSAQMALVTIENSGPNSILVTVVSVTADTIDELVVTNSSVGALGPKNFLGNGVVTRELSWATNPPDTVLMNVLWSKSSYPGNSQLSASEFNVPLNASCSLMGAMQVGLPITFDDTATVGYDLADFGGNISQIITDPTDPTNLVVESIKDSTAQLWAGTTAGDSGLVSPVPFATGKTRMKVRVWSPDANIPVRLKVEDASNGAISVETEAMTTVAGMWETLEFDFTNNVMGTPAINFASTYDKVSIFFNFGTDGPTAGRKTYYWDDVEFVAGAVTKSNPDLPITFEDTATVDYDITDFGGNISQIIVDPTNSNNLVVESIKDSTAQLWAGTTAGDIGLANPIPFMAGATKMTVRVWSPDAGIPVRLKVEDVANGAISVETEAMTTMAGMWETLEFDFTNNVMGTPAINFASTYDKVSIFFNFGTDGPTAGRKTYYWDDVEFVAGAVTKSNPDLPITFEDTATVDYDITDFGGNISQIIVDPTNSNNLVVESIKDSTAQLWAGTTAGDIGLANPIPFMAGATKMTVRVWSPDAGIPVRLKVEDVTNGAISVETEDTTTMAGMWETLEFDFTNNVMGTPAINFANTYDKVSIFFNFGTDGSTAGRKTYYWDDVEFVAGAVTKSNPDLPITFEDTATVDYDITDFGGNISQIIVDPTNSNNLVVESIKDSTAQLWAGTTAGDIGLANPIPFMAGATKMSVRVWSPDANIPVRLKVEDVANGAISVETEAMTTMAGMWETLEFDFTNNVAGTPAINFANTYNKASIFFNFGTDGATAGRKTYYWDDVEFMAASGKANPDLPITFEDTATINYNVVDFGGNISQIVVDPTNSSNLVVESIKDSTAQLWAGTTAGDAGLANPVPFAMGKTKMTVRVWSPDAGIPVRLKAEDAANGAISVETEAMTTMAGMWETLEFDFSNNVAGTPAINFMNTYDKVSIFFNFGTDGATAGRKTYYWDDVQFVDSAVAVPLPAFCNTQVFHMMNPGEVPSSIYLTVENTGANSMKVTIESVDSDSVDFLLINGGSGATIGAEDFSVPGKISRDMTWTGTPPDTVSMNILWSKVSFGGNWQLSPMDVQVLFNTVCLPPAPKPDLPITFEDTVIDYNLSDFAGAASQIVTDPTDPGNTVVETIKTAAAQTFAGTVAGNDGLENPIPFTLEKTRLRVRVWSPDANIPVRLKVEDAGNDQIFAEAETNTTVAMQWETLEFNFLTPPAGAPGYNPANTYGKVIIFFNFGTDGATAGAKTYYWDDVEFVDSAIAVIQPDLPVTFEDTTLGDYNLLDFEGNATQIVVDPTDPTNTVGQTLKTDQAATFAGTVVGAQGLANPIPFDTDKSRLTMRVWSPDAGTPVRLKIEDAFDTNINAEAEVTTTLAMQWETLTFDFSTPPANANALDLNNTYSKVIVFFNFGTDGMTAGAKTYFWDDLAFLDSAIVIPKPDLPITFEDSTLGDYNLTDFGGNASQIVVDPTNPNNKVVESIKTDQAQLWAGTTAGGNGLANAIPFTMNETVMSVRVWSPDAGIPVRLKVEDASNPAISVETEDITTKAADWEYLVFDFSNEVAGTAAINLANTYDKVSIFFNFGTDGMTAGAKTYFWDDVAFGDSTGVNVLPFLDEGVSIYPNPARNQINVRFENQPSQAVQLALYDLNGRKVKAEVIQNLINTIDLGELQEGMYLLMLESKEGIFRQKVMVRR